MDSIFINNLQLRYRSLSLCLAIFTGGSPLVCAASEVLQQEQRCRGLEGISRDGENGFEWKNVKTREDESPDMLCRMEKERTGRWLTRDDWACGVEDEQSGLMSLIDVKSPIFVKVKINAAIRATPHGSLLCLSLPLWLSFPVFLFPSCVELVAGITASSHCALDGMPYEQQTKTPSG